MGTENSIDFVIPTHHDGSFLEYLLSQASENPEWVKHTFHFIFNAAATKAAQSLKDWLVKHNTLLLPKVKIHFAPAQATGQINLLRQIGLNQGQNPFVYFQDDDDPLPTNLDKCLGVFHQNPDCMAVFGLAETYTPVGQLIERFPSLGGGADLVHGLRVFPTYSHGLSALFRREVFQTVPVDDGQNYQMCGINAFIVNLLEVYEDIQTIPQVIRRERQNADGLHSPVFGENRRLLLAEDINLWKKYLSSPAVRRFHEDMRLGLIGGTITAYRDIAARIEEALESGAFRQEF